MDGNLRQIFRKHLPTYHWNSIESGATGSGIPDSEYCAPGGATGWVEFKKATAWRLDCSLSPTQVAWHQRRARAGGRSFIAVRRQHAGGPRKGAPADELWLFKGRAAALIRADGLNQDWGCNGLILAAWLDGPAHWDWRAVAVYLERTQ